MDRWSRGGVAGRSGSRSRPCSGDAPPFFGLAVRLRLYLYDAGVLAVHRVSVPVVSVGNLTVGGTGKTPMVRELVRRLAARERRAAVVSRGYGATTGRGESDEGALLASWLPDVPRRAHPDRVRAAREAVEKDGADCLVLDDGFQHRRLSRDLDVVLVDATEPFGHGRLLPGGLLREPPSSLARAGLVVLTRADQVSAETLAELRRTVSRLSGAPVVEAVHRPVGVVEVPGGAVSPAGFLAGRAVHAFCGIGQPEGFRGTLESLGARVVRFDALGDHHAYGEDELDRLLSAGREAGAAISVTTEKDAVKLTRWATSERTFAYLSVEIAIVSGEAELDLALDRVLEGR
ncbi:MAG: tetraacyldisaccharide 4'-kinase [Planctomycetes bacterium]|nr:tetraacyldisaccharide 4'-kinase [Planctomycetota bacterium]